jgi:hypothetical protein
LEWLLFRQQGVISRHQVQRFLTDRVVSRKLSTGRWQRPHRGVYVTHNGRLTEHQRLWVASLAVGAGRRALLGGVSALQVLGLRRFTSTAIHVLLPGAHRSVMPPAGVKVHRTSRLPAEDIDAKADPPCTQAPRSVVDAASWARSDNEARTIVAMAFQQRLVGRDQIERVLRRLPTAPRRNLIHRTALDAQDGSHTISELDLVTLCRRGGLPVPSRQVIRPDATGRKRYLDAYFDEWGIRLEIDGAHHMDVDNWWDDMRRGNALAVVGEMVLRFAAWVVREHPADVANQIRDALLAAGWRP